MKGANEPFSGLDGLDLKLLRLFDLLYATRSVTRTAERLSQSQPTVSIGLGRLRVLLRDPLFVRTPQGMQPTPRADALVPTVREVLQGLQRLTSENDHFAPESSQRAFRIFMTDASHITMLPQLAAHLRHVVRDESALRHVPRLDFILDESGHRQMTVEQAIAEGLRREGIVPGPDLGSDGVEAPDDDGSEQGSDAPTDQADHT